jgi:hypothetical protein
MKPTTLSGLDRITNDLEQIAGIIRQETAATVAMKDHVALIRHFADMREVMDRIKTAREALQEMTDALSAVHVPDIMREVGIKTINVEGVGRVTVSHRYSCSILDKPKGFEWLRDNDAGALVQETVNSSALASYAKRRLEEDGMDMPPDIFKVGTNPYTSITKR